MKILTQNGRNKILAIGIILLFALSAILVLTPSANAYYNPLPNRPTGTWVGISPTVIGLGQQA